MMWKALAQDRSQGRFAALGGAGGGWSAGEGWGNAGHSGRELYAADLSGRS